MSKLIEKFEGLGWIGIWYLTNSTNINMPKTILEIYNVLINSNREKVLHNNQAEKRLNRNTLHLSKPILKVVLVIFLLLFALSFYEVLATSSRMNEVKRTKDYFDSCSWLQRIPKGWTCDDNWNYYHRVLKASFKNSELILYASVDDFSPETCSFSIPYTVPIHVSAVGITLPWRCIGIDDKLVFSNWYQDGWKFTFVGKNVDRKLYLENLYLVGGLR